MPTVKSKSTDPITAGFKVIATKQCPSLAGTTLTYKHGKDDDETLYIRLHDSTGGGFFNADWVKAEDLADVLRKHQKEDSFTSMVLAPLFKHRSANTQAFFAAVLLAEGALVPYKKTRKLRVGDIDAFLKQTVPVTPKRRKPAAKTARTKTSSTPSSKSKASPAA